MQVMSHDYSFLIIFYAYFTTVLNHKVWITWRNRFLCFCTSSL